MSDTTRCNEQAPVRPAPVQPDSASAYRRQIHRQFLRSFSWRHPKSFDLSGRPCRFYPMNQYSTFARDDDVGSFPINIAAFEKQLSEKLKKNPAMTLAAFIGFMNSVKVCKANFTISIGKCLKVKMLSFPKQLERRIRR